jgi:hypothetical protein
MSHFHVHGGKRRCLTPKMSAHEHARLRDVHEQGRTARIGIHDQQTLHIAVKFHVCAPSKPLAQSEANRICQDILNMMDAGFGYALSPQHDMREIEHGAFLRGDAMNQKRFYEYKELACSANMKFHFAEKPSLYVFGCAPKHAGSDSRTMNAYDALLKEKVAPPLNPNRIYNIWIVTGTKSVLLGYGSFPKVDPSERDLALDGFVYFISPAPYHLHVTAVHESGHVWGLQHPFNHNDDTGEYDDGIEDTPVQLTPDFGPVWFRPGSWPHSVNKHTGAISYHGLPNYMNYVDDNCMFMFTSGQCRRIRDTALTVRSSWNLSATEVDALNGGSPWAALSTKNRGKPKSKGHHREADQLDPSNASVDAKRKKNDDLLDVSDLQKDEQKKQTEQAKDANPKTEPEPFPFRRRRFISERDPQAAKTAHLVHKRYEDSLSNTACGDICNSVFGYLGTSLLSVQQTGKTLAAISFLCC